MSRHSTRHASRARRRMTRGSRFTAPGLLVATGLLAGIVVLGIPLESAQAGERAYGSPCVSHMHVTDASGHGGARRGRNPSRPPQNTPTPDPAETPVTVTPDQAETPVTVMPDPVEPVTAPEPEATVPVTTVHSEVPGLEVIDVVLPPSEPLAEVVDTAVPAPGTASAALVAGFPTALTSAPDSEIHDSELSLLDSALIARLSATTGLGTDAVLHHYAVSLSGLGLSGTPAVTTGSRTVQSFYRGNDSVVVTIDTAPEGSRYALVGTFSLPG